MKLSTAMTKIFKRVKWREQRSSSELDDVMCCLKVPGTHESEPFVSRSGLGKHSQMVYETKDA